MPAFVALAAYAASAGGAAALTTVGTGALVGAQIYNAHQQASAAEDAAKLTTGAANHAADVSGVANANALAFQRQQAENAWKDAQRVEQANYQQNFAHEQRLNTIGQLLGFGARDIPAYVPGTDPHFDTGATPLPSVGPQSAGAALGGQGASSATGSPQAFIAQYQASHPPSEGVQPLLNAMKQAGFNVAPYLYGSTSSNNEISLNGSKYKVIGAENSPAAYWYQPGTNDSAGAPSSAAAPQSVGSYLAQAQQTPFQPLPQYGQAYQPRPLSVGSYLGGYA